MLNSSNQILGRKTIGESLISCFEIPENEWVVVGLGFKGGQSLADGIFREFSYAVNIQLIHNLLTIGLDGLKA